MRAEKTSLHPAWQHQMVLMDKRRGGPQIHASTFSKKTCCFCLRFPSVLETDRLLVVCGIAGALDLEGTRLFDADRLRQMVRALSHRGPDGEGMAE